MLLLRMMYMTWVGLSCNRFLITPCSCWKSKSSGIKNLIVTRLRHTILVLVNVGQVLAPLVV